MERFRLLSMPKVLIKWMTRIKTSRNLKWLLCFAEISLGASLRPMEPAHGTAIFPHVRSLSCLKLGAVLFEDSEKIEFFRTFLVQFLPLARDSVTFQLSHLTRRDDYPFLKRLWTTQQTAEKVLKSPAFAFCMKGSLGLIGGLDLHVMPKLSHFVISTHAISLLHLHLLHRNSHL